VTWFLIQSILMIIVAFLLGLLVGWLLWGRVTAKGRSGSVSAAPGGEKSALDNGAAAVATPAGPAVTTVDAQPEIVEDPSPADAAVEVPAGSVPAESAASEPVEPVAPVSAPAESEPVESARVEPVAVESAPVASARVEPVAVESAPVESARVEPVAVESAPVEAPVESASGLSPSAEEPVAGAGPARNGRVPRRRSPKPADEPVVASTETEPVAAKPARRRAAKTAVAAEPVAAEVPEQRASETVTESAAVESSAAESPVAGSSIAEVEDGRVGPVAETAPEPVAETAATSAVETNPVPVAEAVAAPAGAGGVPDDLRRIEGVGPKMAAALNAAGITTYRELAAADEVTIRAAVTAAGMKFAPSLVTWSRQARLLADGDLAGFAELTGRLKAGREVGAR
jgi:predicted flap endonuclease-1-like 5' DNA nuclease